MAIQNPLIWAAGVFEGGGSVILRKNSDGMIVAADVMVTGCDKYLAEELQRVLSGRYNPERRRWSVPAWDQERVLGLVLMYLRTPSMRAKFRRVLLFRGTQHGGVNPSVKEFRRRLAEEDGLHEG
jgi:hypothetical protein